MLKVHKTLAIEVPLGFPNFAVNEHIEFCLTVSRVSFTCFDAFRIPSRLNTLDAYRIIVYMEKDV